MVGEKTKCKALGNFPV